jgi:hypothetical protein
VQDGRAVDSVVAADRLAALAAAVTPQAVAAVMPQVVAAEDIAVAAVRTEAVTNSYFSPATYAVLRDGVFISPDSYPIAARRTLGIIAISGVPR